ncbi:MAG: PspA/IM30 family protein [Aeromicrobium sp.]|uniref:PspA/IM30 family protein n=1 Tax=Aeromicrobium sp. TaxID=1871063 RepID=UPI0039E29BFF
MGLWDRIRQIARSRREQPDDDGWSERMDLAVRDQQKTLAQLRRSLADLATNRRRVELQLGRLRQQASDLDRQAADLVAAGDDDGARATLTRKVTIDQAVADLDGRHATLLADEQKLAATAAQIETRIEDFRIRKDTLVARQSAAEAKSAVYRTTRDLDVGGVARDLDEVERHTRAAEATADAYDELSLDPTRDADAWERSFEAADPARSEEDGRGPNALPR